MKIEGKGKRHRGTAQKPRPIGQGEKIESPVNRGHLTEAALSFVEAKLLESQGRKGLSRNCEIQSLASSLRVFVLEIVYDLMEASVASNDDINLYIDDGLDGFPAFGFRPGSEVKQPYRMYLPEKLPAEFTLVATFKPLSFRTSYLFAVLNPFETIVQLGIRISDGLSSNQNISLVYTNSDQHSHSEEVAKFTVPKLTKKWSKIVIKVSTNDVTFYLNCHEMARQRVTRIPLELVFDTASTLYIAQAGPHIQEKYDVSLEIFSFFVIPIRNRKKVDRAEECLVE
ncbi:hypothetical protein KM043_012110 [Ampulex compressa]|nr:hypothetical protein KM043_012110 [Ampulex compressa]